MTYPIEITTQEKIHSTCDGCDWCEDASGHLGVVQAGGHSAEHVLITGHTVTEIKTDTVVMAPGSVV